MIEVAFVFKDKDFKSSFIDIFKEIKIIMLKELKEDIIIMLCQIMNINKKIEMFLKRFK